MECTICGKKVSGKEILINDKIVLCDNKCEKIYYYYELEDKVLNYCNKINNHCKICPIFKECSIFLKIEKKIKTDEDILKFNIPIVKPIK